MVVPNAKGFIRCIQFSILSTFSFLTPLYPYRAGNASYSKIATSRMSHF